MKYNNENIVMTRDYISQRNDLVKSTVILLNLQYSG